MRGTIDHIQIIKERTMRRVWERLRNWLYWRGLEFTEGDQFYCPNCLESLLRVTPGHSILWKGHKEDFSRKVAQLCGYLRCGKYCKACGTCGVPLWRLELIVSGYCFKCRRFIWVSEKVILPKVYCEKHGICVHDASWGKVPRVPIGTLLRGGYLDPKMFR